MNMHVYFPKPFSQLHTLSRVSKLLSLILFVSICTNVNSKNIPKVAEVFKVDDSIILYASEKDSGKRGGLEIFTIDSSGKNQRKLIPLTVRGRGEYDPHISPDGRSISYTTYRYGGYKVATQSLITNKVERATKTPHYAYDGAYSPDGKKLVFNRVDTARSPWFRGPSELFILDIDSGKQSRLTKTGQWNVHQSFSPDGSQVVFASRQSNGDYQIALIDSDGGEIKLITNPDRMEFAPSYSPDGKYIAFLAIVDESIEVFVKPVKGGDERQLTDNAKSERKESWGDDNQIMWKYKTSWSPDESKIAFASSMEGDYDIYVVDVATKQLARLTESKELDIGPTWVKRLAR